MKYIVIVGLILAAGIGSWWLADDSKRGVSFDMGEMMSDMMQSDEGESLTKLPERAVASVKPTEVIELKDETSREAKP